MSPLRKQLKKRKLSYVPKGKTLWLTGLPCSGKTTLAKNLRSVLNKKNIKTIHLDGDDLRDYLNQDLGFSLKDRAENIRRAAHVSRLFNVNGINVIASFIAPTNKIRDLVSEIIDHVTIVYVKCDADICEKRDVKGMYRLARKGKIKNFTGISEKFEEPKEVLTVDTGVMSKRECVDMILKNVKLG